ncbi:MAG: GNAT family N-acetyltransferase [Actinomycetota bacterium]|nr:GNAT family N-acetyltransferase [Actinomycetota bacterium]
MRGPSTPFRVDLGDGAVVGKYVLGDLEELWALIEGERERLDLWMPWVAGTTTIEHQRTWLERVVANERSLNGMGIWVGSELAGGIGLEADVFGIAGEIGYWIGSEFEGAASSRSGVGSSSITVSQSSACTAS